MDIVVDFIIVNKDEETDPCYGLEKFVIGKRHLDALLNGEKLYVQINGGEYAIEITYDENKEYKE